jgi:hypothetical protein
VGILEENNNGCPPLLAARPKDDEGESVKGLSNGAAIEV